LKHEPKPKSPACYRCHSPVTPRGECGCRDGICLIHADGRDVLPLLEADIMVTDPPYGIHHSSRSGNEVAVVGETATGRDAKRVLTAEHTSIRDEIVMIWGDLPAIVFGHWRAPRPEGTMMRLVWDKEIFGMGGVGQWRPSDEEIYILNWPNPKNNGGNHGSILRHKALRGKNRPNHPTPKPIGLMRELISNCPPGIILDPFAGSGTTGRACKDLGRRCIMIEIKEIYCRIAANRLRQEVFFA